MVASLKKLAAKAVAEQIVFEDKNFDIIEDLKALVNREVTKVALINKKGDIILKNLVSLATYADDVKGKWKVRKKDVLDLLNELIRVRDLLKKGELDEETKEELKQGGRYIKMIAEQEKLIEKSKTVIQKYRKMMDMLERLCDKFKPEKKNETDEAIEETKSEVEKALESALDKIDKAHECAVEYEPCLGSAKKMLEDVIVTANT